MMPMRLDHADAAARATAAAYARLTHGIVADVDTLEVPLCLEAPDELGPGLASLVPLHGRGVLVVLFPAGSLSSATRALVGSSAASSLRKLALDELAASLASAYLHALGAHDIVDVDWTRRMAPTAGWTTGLARSVGERRGASAFVSDLRAAAPVRLVLVPPIAADHRAPAKRSSIPSL